MSRLLPGESPLSPLYERGGRQAKRTPPFGKGEISPTWNIPLTFSKPLLESMTHPVHPNAALFAGEKPFPVIPACEHFAGSEKLILKALEQMEKLGPVFNITCDCEDGAPAGREAEHAEMIVRVLQTEANHHRMAGARIHDYSHPAWRQDAEILVGGAGELLAYITLPKSTEYAHAAEMIGFIQQTAKQHGTQRGFRSIS
jgi:hypothetical protein